MDVPANHSVVEINLDRKPGLFSAIPERIGPRFESAIGGIIKAERAAGSMTFRTNTEFASIMLAPSPRMEAAFASDKTRQFNAPVGALIINPANTDRTLRWSGMKKNAAFAFGQNVYAELASAELDGNQLELRPPQFGHVDLKALGIATAIADELTNNAVNPIYLDALMTVLGVHLIRKYSGSDALKPIGGARLAQHSAKRVQEYMHENLSDNLSIVSLAKIAKASPGHFIRAFTLTFGSPPHQYLTRIRLEKAEVLLTQTDLSINEIAHRTGFSSQSHLTNTMKRLKHLTPGQIRANKLA